MSVVVDDARLRAALSRLASELDDPSVALKAVGNMLADMIRNNIKTGTQYDGQPMQPLKYRKGVPLRNTGTHILERINAQLIDKTTVAVGMLDGPERIGAVHQFGATIRPKNGKYLRFKLPDGSYRSATQVTIPARPFMPLDHAGNADLPAEWQDDMIELLGNALKKTLS